VFGFHRDYPRFAGSFTAALPHDSPKSNRLLRSTSKGYSPALVENQVGRIRRLTVIRTTHAQVQLALIEFDLTGVVANVVRVRMVSELMRINAPPR